MSEKCRCDYSGKAYIEYTPGPKGAKLCNACGLEITDVPRPALYRLENASALAPGAWRWPHVDPAREWADHLTGRLVYDTAFLDRFESLRATVGGPLIITSGYRTPEHNELVSTTGAAGPHTTGRAVDIRIYGPLAFALLEAALGLGYTGIGLMQRGPLAQRYIHLDDLTAADGFPRPAIWTY